MKKISLFLYLSSLILFPCYSQSVINSYANVTDFPNCGSCLQAGCNEIIVDDISGFNTGDNVLLIQMKGVSINHEDDSTFGQILDYGSAGFHEILEILAVNPATKTVQFTNTIKATYNAADAVQLVKIVKHTNYTVPATGLTCAPWDGKKGGVLFLEVSGTLTLNGDINTSGKGFRGGDLQNASIGQAVLCGTSPEETFSNGRWVIENKQIPYTDYSGTGQDFYYTWYYAGQKGEGIANYKWPEEELGRGPLASGGGAGINHNAGGGGGSNMGRGGHGGLKYSYNANGTGCNKDKGYGLGGYPLDRMGGLRLYLGGGAGSGHENDNLGTQGGDGGGIIVIKAAKIEGNGFQIISDGTNGIRIQGTDTLVHGGNDGCGGGGAGGSIKLECEDFGSSALHIQAKGKNGGNTGATVHGPGGGGGGGLICLTTSESNMTSNYPSVSWNVDGGEKGLTHYNAGTGVGGDPWGTEEGEPGLAAFECSSLENDPPRNLGVSLGGDFVLCNPPSADISTGYSEPGYTHTWYKNGELMSAERNESINISGPGEYSVKVTTPNCPDAFDTVSVDKTGGGTPKDSIFCDDNGAVSVLLEVLDPDPLAHYGWFDQETEGTLINVGLTYNTLPLNATTTYYVIDTVQFEGFVGPKGDGGTQFYYKGNISVTDPVYQDVTEQEHRRKFDAHAPFLLKSVEIQPNTTGGGWTWSAVDFWRDVTIELYQNGDPVGQTATTRIYKGNSVSKLDLNFKIPIGNAYELRLKGEEPYGFLKLSNEYQEEAVDGIVTIAKNAIKSGPFYNWEVKYGSPCGRMPINATKFCPVACEPPTSINLSKNTVSACVNDNINITASPVLGASQKGGYSYTWYQGTPGSATSTLSALNINKIKANKAGTYTLRIEDGNDGDANCYLEESVTIAVNSSPTAPSTTTAFSYCKNETASVLTATTTGTLNWYDSDDNTISTPTPNTAIVGDTTFKVSQTINNCEGPTSQITITVNNTPVAPTTSNPSPYCKGETTNALTATATGTLNWYDNDNNPISTPTPDANIVGDTTFKVSQTINNCESPTSDITVTISDAPAAPTTSNPTPYCKGGITAALNATGAGTLNWYDNDNNSISTPTPDANIVGDTIFKVSQTVNNCESPTSDITVTVHATPNAPTVSNPLPYCQGDVTAALNATGTGTLNWYDNDNNSISTPTPDANIVGDTTFKVSQTVNNCESPTSDITVTVHAIPDAPIVTSPIAYCENDLTSTLSATTTGTAQWYNSDSNPIAAPTPNASILGDTVFHISQTENNCESPLATILVQVHPLPTPIISGATTACFSDSVNYTNTVISLNETYLWSYTSGIKEITNNSSSVQLGFSAAGSHTISIIATDTVTQCISPKVDYNITIDALPTVAYAGTDRLVCESKTALNATQNLIGTGQWTVLQEASPVDFDNPTIYNDTLRNINTDGEYQLQWSVTNGTCNSPQNADTIIITKNDKAEVLVDLSVNDADSTICSGDALIFKAHPLVGGNLTYQWHYNNGTALPTSSNDSLILSNITSELEVFIELTSDLACIPLGEETASSDTIIVAIEEIPVAKITTPPTFNKTGLTNVDNYLLKAQNPGDYTTSWHIANTLGSPTLATPNDTSTLLENLSEKEIPYGSGNGTSTLVFSVTGKACPTQTDTAYVIYVDETTPKAGNDTTICISSTLPFTRTGNAFISNSESATWTSNNTSIGTNITNNGQTLEITSIPDSGTYTFNYIITSALGTDTTDSFQLTVEGLPTASITTPSVDTFKTRDPNFTLQALNISNAVYQGTWSIIEAPSTDTSIFSQVNSSTTNILGLAGYEDMDTPLNEGTTTIQWEVNNISNACPASQDTVVILRVDETSPFAGIDTSICIIDVNEFTRKGNTFNPSTETATWTSDDPSVLFTVIDSINFKSIHITRVPSPGTYTFRYEVENFGLGTPPINDPFELTVIDTASKATIIPSSDSLSTCDSSYQITALVPAVGLGQWSANAIANDISGTNNEIIDINNMVKGSNHTLFWSTSTGNECPVSQDSIVITRLNLTIPNIIDLNNALCENEANTQLFANTPLYNEQITWSGNGVDNQGLVDISSLNRGVNKIYLAFDNGLCSSHDSTIISIDSLPSPANITHLQDTITTCASTATLTASIPTTGIGTWKVNGLNPTSSGTGNEQLNVTAMNEGTTYTFYWITSTNGTCPESKDSIVIDRLSLTEPLITDLGSSKCEDAFNFQMSSNTKKASEIATWTGDGIDINGNVDMALLSIGNHKVFLTYANNECSATDSSIITIDELPSQAFIINPSADTSICGGSTNLLAHSPSPATAYGRWSLTHGTAIFSNSSSTSTQVDDLELETNNKLRWTVSNGACVNKSYDEISIYRLQEEKVQISSFTVIDEEKDDTGYYNLCFDDHSYMLKTKAVELPQTTFNYYYRLNDSTLAQADTLFELSQNTYPWDEHFTVIVKGVGGCLSNTIDSSSIDLRNQSLTPPILSGADHRCETLGPLFLTFEDDNRRIERVKWYKDDEEVAGGFYLDQLSYKFPSSRNTGDYSITVSNDYCPEKTSNYLFVELDEQPHIKKDTTHVRVDLSHDGQYSEAYVGMQIQESITNADIEWNPEAELSNPNIINPQITPTQDGYSYYYVLVKNGFCSAYDSLKVQVVMPFHAPTAITPNGDGVNDTWKVDGLRGVQATVRIYNRWGHLIYERFAGYLDQFDGTYKGSPLPSGTYYWTVDFVESENEDVSGTITILY